MMRAKVFISIVTGAVLVTLFSLVSSYKATERVDGWFAAGSEPKSYNMGTTTDDHHSGKSCAYIKSVKTDINGFGTYMQMTQVGEYLGKSVRMTGWIRSKDVKDWAGMWFRVDGDNAENTLSFDNMQDRPITGTSEWKKYEIVLDVPKEAKALAFGVLLSGTGEIFFDDMNFEILGPATGKSSNKGMAAKPSNLDFEK